MSRPAVDPVRLQVMKDLFASVAEEMGTTLERTGLSPNIKERLDFSCAVFDGEARMIAQAAHIPVHLGSTPLAVESAIRGVDMRRGDEVLVNDPYAGGTHLPDFTLVSPVFLQGDARPAFYVANRAHHSDVGGASAGSMGVATEIHAEGLRIPPVRIVRGGEVDAELLRLVLANMRVPRERAGDLAAQRGANAVGARRLERMVSRYGRDELDRSIDELLDYSERLVRALLAEIPDGTYRFEDALDGDGLGDEPVPIRLAVHARRGEVRFDFAGSSPQVAGPVNAVRAVTLSAVFYVLRTLLPLDVPTNAGILRAIRLETPPGSVVDARAPAAVSAGNVETSQRIVDVVYGALARALPGRVPAASAGTMSNLAFGGRRLDADHPLGPDFTYYETNAGGMGARPDRDGLSAVQTHMTNTRNTPIEALEHAYPVLVRRYGIRRGSGGRGRFRGGDGLVREIEARVPLTATVVGERRELAPYGLDGGEPGKRGRDAWLGRDGRRRRLPGKAAVSLEAGDALRIETPGGGGYGRASRARGRGRRIRSRR